MIKPLRARPLQQGDTVALVSPAGALYDEERFLIATETLQAMGLQVKWGKALQHRRGYLAGYDADRADDINEAFSDQEVKAIIAMRGGYGSARLLPLLNYTTIAQNPKIVAGFSDITALLQGIYTQTGLITFHAPVANSAWTAFTVQYFQQFLFGELPLPVWELRHEFDARNVLLPLLYRTQCINPGTAEGILLGGNLCVLASLAGSCYLPDFKDAILFLEEVNEEIYKVDRLLCQLHLAGIFSRVKGVVLGHFTDCKPASGFGSLTLHEVFNDYFANAGIPVFSGAAIGHIPNQFTLPVGARVCIDAEAGSIRLLEPALEI